MGVCWRKLAYETIIRSIAKAKYCGNFLNIITAVSWRIIAHNMGHPQSLTSIICNNTTGVGLSNDTIKKKYTKPEMRGSIISRIRYNRQIYRSCGSLELWIWAISYCRTILAKFHQEVWTLFVFIFRLLWTLIQMSKM